MQPTVILRRPASLALPLALALLVATVRAQPADRAKGEKAAPQGVTDAITVAGGGEIRGAVIKKLPDGSLDVAVQREWLDAHAPEAAAALVAEERRQTRSVMESLATRLAKAIADMPESRSRVLALLRREADRVDAWIAADDARKDREEADAARAAAGGDDGSDVPRPARRPGARRDESQFALLRIAPKRVVRVRSSGQAAQRIARWAWSERLADVEGRSAAELTKELKARGIDPTAPPPPLGDRLPPLPQDDREWASRMALVEDALGDSVAFQGIGDTVVKSGQVGEGLAGILPQLMQWLGPAGGGGLGEILRGLGDGGLPGVPNLPRPPPGDGAGPAGERWLDAAREQAAEAGRFRATRVKLDPAAGRAEVETVFQARMPDGSWETVWRDVEAADANTADEAAVERITADERIGGILQTIRGLGVVDEGAIMQAIRVGAATMKAQGTIDARFTDFRSRHIRRLDLPPLRPDGR